MPLWVTDPPEDDELNIYLVGVGKDDEVIYSVISQLYSRFNIKKNEYFESMIVTMLNNPENENISIIDEWSSDTLDYILVRMKKSFFDPVLYTFSTRYEEMLNFSHENELEGDKYLKNGEYYSAYNQYLIGLDEMLQAGNVFYTPAILNVINKISEILNKIKFINLETFSTLTIGKAIVDEHLSFEIPSKENESFNSFLIAVEFSEGWVSRKRKVTIPLRNNSLLFIPPIPKNSGLSSITSYLNLDELEDTALKYIDHLFLSNEIKVFKSFLDRIITDSKISFEFSADSNLKSFDKIISFDNSLTSEGIQRYLLEVEDNSVLSPLYIEDETFLTYIREIDTITGSLYNYMVFGNEIIQEITPFDEDGILVKLSCGFNLVDMFTGKIIQTQNITTEFIGVLGEENLAYIDLGLKIGEVIYEMKF